MYGSWTLILYRVAKKVRGNFSYVDKLIYRVEKIFRKPPNRVQLFKDEFFHLNLTPEPTITLWSSEYEECYSSPRITIVKTLK